ncbi:MAG: response regulator transcription factor [Candidatus Acidiferrales bacterium]
MADDHLMLIGAFKSVLEPKYEVVGLVTDGRALLEAAERLQPDIIVTDIAMPQLNGLDAARKLKEITPGIKLIFITMNPDPFIVREAFRAGAAAFLLKQEACSGLPAAIEQVLKGGTYVSPQTAEGQTNISLREPKDREHASEPTARQREVIQLLAEGLSMKQVADALKITKYTVALHKYTVMQKLQIKSSAELVQYAIKHNIISV